MCDGEAPPTWQATVAVDAMATTIVFGGASGGDVALREAATTVTLGHFVSPRWGWSVTFGGVVDGSIDRRPLHGGGTLAVGASWLPVYERARRPFVGLAASVGTSLVHATADDGSIATWSAWDVRAGGMLGKTFADVLVPYVAARVFGGPVFWAHMGAGVVGGDRYHVTAGAGLTVRLPERLSLTVEGLPLGERSATAAVTARF